MPNLVQSNWESRLAFTLSAASLAANGGARASLAIANAAGHQAAWISGKLTTGASAPTVDQLYTIYLAVIDDDSTYGTDGWGGTDEAITTLRDAAEIGSIAVPAATGTAVPFMFSTKRAIDRLPEDWGIIAVNWTDQIISVTGGDHVFRYRYANDEIQDSA